MSDLRRTPLDDLHRRAGARMGDFGGWDMPIEYPTGVVAEHTAVRTDVGVFDVSHMGKLVARGPGAADALNAILANDLGRIGPGRAQYTLLCTEQGGVVDDLLAYLASPDEVVLVPNAANAGTVRDVIAGLLPPGVALADRQEQDGILAVQGPRSAEVLTGLGVLPADADLPYMGFLAGSFRGAPALACRSGYTGERGFEVVLEVEELPELWSAVVAAGAVPCGLGARDTLRTEMGYPLHGQDISPSITPVEAGLGWAIGWDKPQFPGRAALLRQRAEGPRRSLRGVRMEGRGIPRPGMAVSDERGARVGTTTSGTFSPTLRAGIALALVDAGITVGSPVAVDIRGREVPARIVRTPFVDRSPR
jgi:aminomethyltransferase